MDFELMLIEMHNAKNSIAMNLCFSIAIHKYYKYIDKNEYNG